MLGNCFFPFQNSQKSIWIRSSCLKHGWDIAVIKAWTPALAFISFNMTWWAIAGHGARNGNYKMQKNPTCLEESWNNKICYQNKFKFTWYSLPHVVLYSNKSILSMKRTVKKKSLFEGGGGIKTWLNKDPLLHCLWYLSLTLPLKHLWVHPQRTAEISVVPGYTFQGFQVLKSSRKISQMCKSNMNGEFGDKGNPST